jgi:predicted HNH restriction endonuclease
MRIANHGEADGGRKPAAQTSLDRTSQPFLEKWIQREAASLFRRSPQVARLVRDKAKGKCPACETDVVYIYGADVIEAHHRAGQPPKSGREVTERDLAALCPTCHRALHRLSKPGCRPITVECFQRMVER